MYSRHGAVIRSLCFSFTVLSLVLLSVTSVFSEDIIIGKRMTLHSDILGKEMKLAVHVPESYQQSDTKYPVLYTFQTHFEMAAGAIKCLYDRNQCPEIIVVQVSNYEFGYLTPTTIESNPNSGQADEFLRFFEEELFPHIDSLYPTEPYRIVFSNSWGAMFGAYAILAKPHVFNAAIASIPWVMYDGEDRFMINNAASFLENGSYGAHFLYMSMDNEQELLPELEAFVRIIEDNPRPGLRWEYHHWPEEDHVSTPYRSIYSGLASLYDWWSHIPDSIVDRGLEGIKAYENAARTQYGHSIGLSGFALRAAGQRLQQSQRPDEAIAVYKYVIEQRPDDAFAYVTLGRAYEANNQNALAKEAFDKAYEVGVATSARQLQWIKSHLDRINEKLSADTTGQ